MHKANSLDSHHSTTAPLPEEQPLEVMQEKEQEDKELRPELEGGGEVTIAVLGSKYHIQFLTSYVLAVELLSLRLYPIVC